MTKFKTYYLRAGFMLSLTAGLLLFSYSPSFAVVQVGSGTKTADTVTSQPETPNDSFSPYEDATHGFMLLHPNGWTKTVSEQDGIATVSFVAPPDAEPDKYSETMSVTVQGLGDTKMTLEQYSQLLQDHLKQNITAYNLDTLEKTTLGGQAAIKLLYTGKQDNLDVVWMQVYTIKDSKVYIMTFAIEYDRYTYYYPQVDRVLRLFNFL